MTNLLLSLGKANITLTSNPLSGSWNADMLFHTMSNGQPVAVAADSEGGTDHPFMDYSRGLLPRKRGVDYRTGALMVRWLVYLYTNWGGRPDWA